MKTFANRNNSLSTHIIYLVFVTLSSILGNLVFAPEGGKKRMTAKQKPTAFLASSTKAVGLSCRLNGLVKKTKLLDMIAITKPTEFKLTC